MATYCKYGLRSYKNSTLSASFALLSHLWMLLEYSGSMHNSWRGSFFGLLSWLSILSVERLCCLLLAAVSKAFEQHLLIASAALAPACLSLDASSFDHSRFWFATATGACLLDRKSVV